jgi:hypothetical protein
MSRVLVYGLGIAGASVARALVARGNEVILADDQLSSQHEQLGRELGTEIFPAGDLGALAGLAQKRPTAMPQQPVGALQKVPGQQEILRQLPNFFLKFQQIPIVLPMPK